MPPKPWNQWPDRHFYLVSYAEQWGDPGFSVLCTKYLLIWRHIFFCMSLETYIFSLLLEPCHCCNLCLVVPTPNLFSFLIPKVGKLGAFIPAWRFKASILWFNHRIFRKWFSKFVGTGPSSSNQHKLGGELMVATTQVFLGSENRVRY